MKSVLNFFVIVFFIGGCGKPGGNVLPFYNTPDFMPVWLQAGDAGYNHIHTIPPFSLVNQNGEHITNKKTTGKIYVANFFFTTCPTLCPKTMANMALVRQAFAGDTSVLILSHSVTPLKDSVPVLAHYAAEHHITGRNWWLLTGGHDAIYKLARKGYFAEYETGFTKEPGQFLHSENFVLIDQKGRIRGVYNGSLPFEVNRLIRHIKLLQASGGA